MFTFRRVETEEELEEVYRLRFHVYCTECSFESPDDHPDGRETDEYDAHSIHFIAIDPAKNIVGSVRLIKHSELGFPIEKYCNPDIDTSRLPKDRVVEISRLAISKAYRRRDADGLYGTYKDDVKGNGGGFKRRDHRPNIILGLFKAMYRESKWLGIVNWYVAMEKSLYVLLRRYGFDFYAVGAEVQYHGRRKPYISRIGNIESSIAKERPEVFKFFTDWPRRTDYEI
jgi:N-acyl amino acid synthase of PEP-CTERM/exosortase system